jgi:hypothetical protein
MMCTMSMLPDDTYDVFVIDANNDDDDTAMRLELTVTRGPHKGDVVVVHASHLNRDVFDVIGLPAQLRVEHGTPTITFD